MTFDPIETLDVPLLVALSSLLERGSVTAAARALGRSQSSVSRTLARLREVFGDPLLVSSGRTMHLTPRAEALRVPVARALEAVRRLFAPANPTSPRDERRTVHIAAADYTNVVLLNGWIASLRRKAPGVTVRIVTVDAGSIEPLARGDLDLAIAPFLPGVGLDQFVAKRLWVDRYVCVLRRGHPRAKRRLTLREYLKLEHVMVGSVLPTVSSVDEALHRLGAKRTVVARVPSVLAALTLAADSELAATSYGRIVPFFGDRFVVRALPFEVPPLELHLMWHPRQNGDPFHRWLREDLLAHAAKRERGRVEQPAPFGWGKAARNAPSRSLS
ncbi:MAG: LysR family transcriptional regulator [Gammaproteobacteria bacterium]